MNVNEYMEER